MNVTDYLLSPKPMSFQMVMLVGATVFIVPSANDAIQRSLLASIGAEIELAGRVRVERCFVAPFEDVVGALREELPLTEKGPSSFEEVFSRYWAQEHQNRQLSPETQLFVLVVA